MAGYTKLFSEIIASSIWQKDTSARIVWITMLALASRRGEVVASVPGLAHIANVSLDKCKKALKILETPDTSEGGYIKKTDNGFQMLDFAFWRQKIKDEERQNYLAKKQAERRARLKKQKG